MKTLKVPIRDEARNEGHTQVELAVKTVVARLEASGGLAMNPSFTRYSGVIDSAMVSPIAS